MNAHMLTWFAIASLTFIAQIAVVSDESYDSDDGCPSLHEPSTDSSDNEDDEDDAPTTKRATKPRVPAKKAATIVTPTTTFNRTAKHIKGPAAKEVRKAKAKTVMDRAKVGEYPEEYINMEETDWSLTISVRGGHIPPVWFTSLAEWLEEFSPRFSISLERGGRQQHLHIQGILALPWPKDEIKELVALLKAILGVRRGDKSGCVIEVRRMLLSTNLSRNFILT